MCFNQKGDISTLDGTSLKLVNKFTFQGSSVPSTEKDIDTRLTKAWTAIDRLSIICKSNLTDKRKGSFFQAAVVSILLYGCTTWTLTKRLEKKLYDNYTRMLRAILKKSWQQHPTRHQLYGHLPPTTKTIQTRRTRHAGHCWRSKDEHVSDVLLWTPVYGKSKTGRPARTFIQQLCEDTGCNPEDLPEAKNDRETWRERGSGISVLAARHDDDDDEEIRRKTWIFTLCLSINLQAGKLNSNQLYLNLTLCHIFSGVDWWAKCIYQNVENVNKSCKLTNRIRLSDEDFELKCISLFNKLPFK